MNNLQLCHDCRILAARICRRYAQELLEQTAACCTADEIDALENGAAAAQECANLLDDGAGLNKENTGKLEGME